MKLAHNSQKKKFPEQTLARDCFILFKASDELITSQVSFNFHEAPSYNFTFSINFENLINTFQIDIERKFEYCCILILLYIIYIVYVSTQVNNQFYIWVFGNFSVEKWPPCMEPYNHGNIYATLGILLIFSLIPLFLGPVEFFWILEDMGSSWREVCSTTDSWQRRPEMGTHFHFITTLYIKKQYRTEKRINKKSYSSIK